MRPRNALAGMPACYHERRFVLASLTSAMVICVIGRGSRQHAVKPI